MLDTLFALGNWNWLIVGILLVGVEAIMPGVFMLWLGLAALIIGALSFGVAVSWPMQIVGPEEAAEPDWRDVVIVPANGQVTVRVDVRDHPGRTVYHCHILDHEDLGMMGVVEAV